MNRKALISMMSFAIALGVAGTAAAAPAQDAIEACKGAVSEAAGDEVVTKLMKIKPRGANYEVWLNVVNDDQTQRSYCYLRRGEVQQFVTEDGKWVGRNPRRPESVDLS